MSAKPKCSCHENNHEHASCNHDLKNCDLKLNIIGLDCPNCAIKVEEKINDLDIIEEAKINFLDKIIKVKLKNESSDEEVIKIIQETIDKVENGVRISKDEIDQDDNLKHNTQKLIISTLVFIGSVFLMHYYSNFSLLICIISYLIIGKDVLLTALKNIKQGQVFDENFLMTLATIGAIYTKNYHEALAVMLFYEIGEYLQHKAVDHSTKSIKSLVEIKSEFANVLKDNKKVVTKVEDVKLGDIIIVQNGERIPLDGIIIEGNTQLDTSAISGESLPQSVNIGDKVLSGSINKNQIIKVKVTSLSKDSTVSKIMQLVQEASDRKSKTEKFITKFAKVYTPVVVGLAAIFLIIMVLINGFSTFDLYLNRACIFLVISCPCALVVSIPLGVFAGIGKCSRVGVLIKGGNYLEQLNDIKNIALDKTGTITTGTFSVTNYSDEKTLMLATYGEYYSNHPLAKTIVNYSNIEVDETRLSNYQEMAGKGIRVLLDNKELLVGNKRLLLAFNIECNEDYGIMVAYDGEYVGHIVVEDMIKSTSKEAIRDLQKLNKKVYMLSGDKKEIVSKVQQELSIDQAYGELLPQEKSEYLEQLITDGKTLFVGDGINDAPSIMLADVGVSMGGLGSDAAVEASDIVITNDDLNSLVKAIKIAKKTKSINYQNIAFALIIKTVILITSALGLTNMWLGVFADVGVTLIAVINALRILK